MKTKLIVALVALIGLPEFTYAQAPPITSSASGNSSGFLAGAQAGYNWQTGAAVYGVEADIAGTGLKTTLNSSLPALYTPLPTANTTSKIDWYGTVRGRLGWATGPALFYGTGGLAYGRLAVNSTLIDTFSAVSQNVQSASVKTGWVLGAGIDYLINPNLILNLSYQYVDLGVTNLAASGPILAQSVSARGRFQEASVGLNWLFAPPPAPVARMPYKAKAPIVAASSPWQGFYAGGHAGGAWGDPANASYSDATIFKP